MICTLALAAGVTGILLGLAAILYGLFGRRT